MNVTYRLKKNGWRKIYHANTYQKKAALTLTSDRPDFKVRKIFQGLRKGLLHIKESILSGDIILNVFVPNDRTT